MPPHRVCPQCGSEFPAPGDGGEHVKCGLCGAGSGGPDAEIATALPAEDAIQRLSSRPGRPTSTDRSPDPGLFTAEWHAPRESAKEWELTRRPRADGDAGRRPGPDPNRWALAAFSAGIVGLVPCLGLLLGPIALILGLIGVRRSRVAGRAGYAYAGITLGALIGLANWGLLIAGLSLGGWTALTAPFEAKAGPRDATVDPKDGQLGSLFAHDRDLRFPDSAAGLRKFRKHAALRAVVRLEYPYIKRSTFSRDGKWVAVAGWDDVKLWEMATSRHRVIVPGACEALAFSPDSKFLAVAKQQGGNDIDVLGMPAGALVARLKEGDAANSAQAVGFSPDGHLFAAATTKGLRLWAVDGWQEQPGSNQEPRPYQDILAFSPDGMTLAFGGWGVFVLWDVEKAKPRFRLDTTESWGRPGAFAPHGNLLATQRTAGLMELWDAQKGVVVRTLKETSAFGPAVFSPDGKTLFSTGPSGGPIVWETATGKLLTRITRIIGTDDSAVSMALSTDGKTLFVTSKDGIIEVWDVPALLREAAQC